VLAAVASVRDQLRVPVVCLTYWNLILQFGISRFVQQAARSGFSGIIVPDLSVEEGASLRAAVRRVPGMHAIFLASPTSSAARLRVIVKATSGFIYYVSVTGTTGVRQALPRDLQQGVRQVKLLTTKPVCVGFGIATPAQARAVARVADGVIVGSALVQRISQAKTSAAAVRAAARFVRQLRDAL
jgi:tryptophan synthase alpha chain